MKVKETAVGKDEMAIGDAAETASGVPVRGRGAAVPEAFLYCVFSLGRSRSCCQDFLPAKCLGGVCCTTLGYACNLTDEAPQRRGGFHNGEAGAGPWWWYSRCLGVAAVVLAPTSRDKFVGSLPVRPTYTVRPS